MLLNVRTAATAPSKQAVLLTHHMVVQAHAINISQSDMLVKQHAL
jgi:hypothetical protein